MLKTSKIALWCGVSFLACPVSALGQTQTNAGEPSSGGQTGNAALSTVPPRDELDIVVTAQRREQRLQDVPISVAVVTGETLKDRSIQNFEQLARLSPNLTVAKTPAANLIVMRGIGSGPGSPSLDQSVVMFIDGIYAGNARQFTVPFLDIERLEILRGPQGALVGRNTSAGAINIVTNKPGDVVGGYVDANYNFTFKTPSIEGGIDLPLSSAMKVRVVGKYSDGDGYIYNTLVDRDQPNQRMIAGRATLVIDNGGPVVATAKFEHADSRVEGIPTQLIAPSRGQFLDYVKSTKLTTGPEYENVTSNNAMVQFSVDLGGPTLVAISGYSGFKNVSLVDADFFAGDFANADFDQKLDQLSQEIRLVSPTGPAIEYSLGAYYSASKLYEQRTTGVLFAPAASTYRQFRQDETVKSIYGHLTWKATEQLKINGGARYTDGRKTAKYRRFAGPQAQLARVGTLVADFEDEVQDGRFDPSVSIQFEPSANIMLYASYAKGSKSAGFQGAISNATALTFSFLPERSTSYEAGAKLSFRGLGFFNVAAFYTTYRDLQVSTGIATPGALSASFFTGNAPEARIQGLEAEFSLRPARFFQLDGSASWLPVAKYVDFRSGPCITLQPSTGLLPGTCDQSGFRLAYAPKFSGALNATLTAPLSNSLVLKLVLSPNFQSRSFRDFSGDSVTAQGAFAKLDARIAVQDPDGSWELALIGKNLTDRKTIVFGSTAGLANTFFDPAARTGTIDPPRTIAAQARFKF